MADKDPWNARSTEEEAEEMFFEEEGDEETDLKKKAAQEEVEKAGMLLVSGTDWKKKLKRTLDEACIDKEKITKKFAPDAEIYEKVQEASKATCFVLRPKSDQRPGGNGTGFLFCPKHEQHGWLVITNNHLIQNDEEAKSAKVVFDYKNDDSKEGTTICEVSGLVCTSLRTKDGEDETTLDFSVLALKPDKNTDKLLLKYRTMSVTPNIIVSPDLLEMCGLNSLPIIAFSHPRGLAKRISIGKHPDNSKVCLTTHIKHDLPTARGSSGANLLISTPISDTMFSHWMPAFLHYRQKRAVAWQAIVCNLITPQKTQPPPKD